MFFKFLCIMYVLCVSILFTYVIVLLIFLDWFLSLLAVTFFCDVVKWK